MALCQITLSYSGRVDLIEALRKYDEPGSVELARKVANWPQASHLSDYAVVVSLDEPKRS
jgi:hypothetical protein